MNERVALISALAVCALCTPTMAFMEHLFQQQRQGQQQQQQQESHQDRYLSQECDQYLCADTLKCVASPVDCPCPFPESQVKCVLPGDSGSGGSSSYVCVSKGSRDCEFVIDAYNGLV